MKNLTPEEKIEILKNARFLLEDRKETFICSAVNFASNFKIPQILVFKYIPELLKYKPEETYTDICWFRMEEYKTRIKIINKTIKDLK